MVSYRVRNVDQKGAITALIRHPFGTVTAQGSPTTLLFCWYFIGAIAIVEAIWVE